MLNIVVDSHLRISGLSSSWIEGLARAVSVENEAKERAQREKVRGANYMDDLLTLAVVDEDCLLLPRGFQAELEDLLSSSGHEYKLLYNLPSYDDIDINSMPKLKGVQSQAAEAIIKGKQGRIIMPTGEGKTVIALSAIAKIAKPTLILVDKIHIAKQWQARAKQHIDYSPGLIGDNTWDEKPITIALLQTLRSRKNNLDDWWGKWAVIIHDEQHHIPAESYSEIVQKFPAPYRIGLSATIGKSEAKKKISKLIFGPILFESKEQLIKPDIKVVETNLTFDYQPTRKIGKKVIRNNYSKLIDLVVNDPGRNFLIASHIKNEQDHANLIVSRRLAHLDTLRELTVELGFNSARCWMLTGKESSEERMRIYEWADEGRCAIFSTVADEALDIPRLDRLHLAFPQKNEETVKQQLGRIVRQHPEKTDAIAYDYVDSKIGIINNQFNHRLRNLYQVQKLKVYKISQ